MGNQYENIINNFSSIQVPCTLCYCSTTSGNNSKLKTRRQILPVMKPNTKDLGFSLCHYCSTNKTISSPLEKNDKSSNIQSHDRNHTIKEHITDSTTLASKPIPCPNLKNNNALHVSSWEEDDTYERDVAYYDRATWMMYHRIIHSRFNKQHHHRYQHEQKEEQKEVKSRTNTERINCPIKNTTFVSTEGYKNDKETNKDIISCFVLEM